mgnify:CR=1 FL=1
MRVIREYKRAESLEEAWQLNQKKSNRVLGGMVWLKMGKMQIGTAIDLSGLGLDTIEETGEEFRIGCMVTLRDLELDPGLNSYTDGAARESVRHIVGVQFRNLATVGGSIYGRFGFSDVLTLFAALDCYVELYKGGNVPIQEFIHMNYDNDILVAVHIVKTPVKITYLSQRNTATDFPVIAVAVSEYNEKLHVSIGARPVRAETLTLDLSEKADMEHLVKKVQEQFSFGSNRRGSADYRRHIAGVLVKRACAANEQQEDRK